MKLLVTNLESSIFIPGANNTFVSIVDTDDGSCTNVIAGGALSKNNYFGMCFINNLLYISKDSSLVVYDINFNLIDTKQIPFPAGEIHQITAYNNKVFLTNTKYDSIIIFDLSSNTFSEFKIINSDSDTKHVNSIFFENDFIYVCCHNRGLSEVMKYDMNWNLQEILQAGLHSHNIWNMDNKLWTLSSGREELFCISDKQKKKIVIPNGRTGFFRGIVQANNKLYFGSSIDKKSMRNSEGVLYELETSTVCGIGILNPTTYVVERFINLPSKTYILEMVALPPNFGV
jgi:hypothetical protein